MVCDNCNDIIVAHENISNGVGTVFAGIFWLSLLIPSCIYTLNTGYFMSGVFIGISCFFTVMAMCSIMINIGMEIVRTKTKHELLSDKNV